MIKFVLLFSIFSLSGYLGIAFSKVYSNKLNFYEDLINFCKTIKNEISFMKTDIITLLKKQTYKSKLNDILVEIQKLYETETILKKDNALQIFDKFEFLNEKDKECLMAIFCDLGQVGLGEQIDKIEYNIQQVNELLLDCKEKTSKIIPLCKKMGFLTGLLVCIVLI